MEELGYPTIQSYDEAVANPAKGIPVKKLIRRAIEDHLAMYGYDNVDIEIEFNVSDPVDIRTYIDSTYGPAFWSGSFAVGEKGLMEWDFYKWLEGEYTIAGGYDEEKDMVNWEMIIFELEAV